MHIEVDSTSRMCGNWLTKLDAPERTTLIATFAGWMLDGMDVMVFSFVLPTLMVLWHISKAQAGLLGTSSLLLSAIGGWLAGLAADRWGRVRVLQLTIVWFAFFTFLSGFTNSFQQLFLVRGQEFSPSVLLVDSATIVKRRHRQRGVVKVVK